MSETSVLAALGIDGLTAWFTYRALAQVGNQLPDPPLL
jgi:hypothetical protein